MLHLRALALFASLAAAGDTQFGLVEERGLLAPLLALWRGGDPLVRLNAVELFTSIARAPAGVAWLSAQDVLLELCAVLDVDEAEDVMIDLMRPAVLGCLASLLEVGGPSASSPATTLHFVGCGSFTPL